MILLNKMSWGFRGTGTHAPRSTLALPLTLALPKALVERLSPLRGNNMDHILSFYRNLCY